MKKVLFALAASLAAFSLMAEPSAVIFDFGGVLTAKSQKEARDTVVNFLQEWLGLSAEEFEKVNQEKRQAIRQGKTDEEFWISYAAIKGVDLDDWIQRFREVFAEAVAINPRMYSLVEELQNQQIRVGLLSNVDKRFAKLIGDLGFYQPFDPCLLSCEMGVEKPDPKIYEMLIERLGFPAEKIVFIDDNVENVKAAKKLGLDAIAFESEEQIRRELHQRK